MTDHAQPSVDPANDGSVLGMFKQLLGKFLQSVDDMLPAIVLSYDRVTNVAEVQPVIKMLTTEGTLVSRAPLSSVPVLQIGGGGFMLNFPLKAGDLGYIKANDRDITRFIQSMKETGPNTLRKHSFEDGVFIPSIVRGYTINSEDADNIVLQKLDGSVRVALWSDRVKVTAPHVVIVGGTDVNITAPTINMSASSQINLTTPQTNITGALASGTGVGGGDATFNGNIVATGEVTGSGTHLHTHTHSGVQTGGGNTGPPV